jgi:hypothetical protein
MFMVDCDFVGELSGIQCDSGSLHVRYTVVLTRDRLLAAGPEQKHIQQVFLMRKQTHRMFATQLSSSRSTN